MRILNGTRAMMAAILAVGFLAPAGAVCATQCVPEPAVVESGCCHKAEREVPSCHKDDGTGSGDCTCHFDAEPTARPAAPAAFQILVPILSVVLPPVPDHAEGIVEPPPNPAPFGTDSGPPGAAPPLHRSSRAPPVIPA